MLHTRTDIRVQEFPICCLRHIPRTGLGLARNKFCCMQSRLWNRNGSADPFTEGAQLLDIIFANLCSGH